MSGLEVTRINKVDLKITGITSFLTGKLRFRISQNNRQICIKL